MSDELLARLTALEDERAILRTLYSYAHAIDYGDEQGWVDCFTSDGTFTVKARDGGYEPYKIEGRAALLEFASHHTRPPGLWHKHLLIEPVIDVDGEQAAVRSYFAVLVEHDGQPTLRVFGRYLDRMRKQPDGRWRLLEREAEIESIRPGLPPLAGGRDASPGVAPRGIQPRV
jgi:ketosteroid isomerase-like protein